MDNQFKKTMLESRIKRTKRQIDFFETRIKDFLKTKNWKMASTYQKRVNEFKKSKALLEDELDILNQKIDKIDNNLLEETDENLLKYNNNDKVIFQQPNSNDKIYKPCEEISETENTSKLNCMNDFCQIS